MQSFWVIFRTWEKLPPLYYVKGSLKESVVLTNTLLTTVMDGWFLFGYHGNSGAEAYLTSRLFITVTCVDWRRMSLCCESIKTAIYSQDAAWRPWASDQRNTYILVCQLTIWMGRKIILSFELTGSSHEPDIPVSMQGRSERALPLSCLPLSWALSFIKFLMSGRKTSLNE